MPIHLIIPDVVYTVKGTITGNDAPNGVEGVEVTLSGIAFFSAFTDNTGYYEITDVFDGNTYTLSTNKAGFVRHTTVIIVDGEDIEYDILLNEVPYPVGIVTAEVVADDVLVQWTEPTSVVELRFDSGTNEGQIGFQNGTALGVIGSAHRVSSVLEKMTWYFTDNAIQNLVDVFIFGLDANGNPDRGNLIFTDKDIPNTPLQWVEYEFPEPINVPNGFFMALSPSEGGFLSLGTDVPNEEYPFQPMTHFYSAHFGMSDFVAFEQGSIFKNAMIRAQGIFMGKTVMYGYSAPEENSSKEHIGYNVYRFERGADEEDWDEIEENVSGLSYTDNDWSTLPWGEYRYAVKAKYTGGLLSPAKLSNVLANKMHVNFRINIETDSNDPATGATIWLTNQNGNPEHVYTATSGADGILMEGIWRGTYNVTISKPGFMRYSVSNLDITIENGVHNATLLEVPYPVGTVTADRVDNNAVITWEEPILGMEKTYILDDNSFEQAVRILANSEASLGNQFNVNEDGFLLSIDVYGVNVTDNTNRPVTIDIYDGQRELIGTSESFVIPGNNWINVPLNNIPYSTTFYVMIRWPSTTGNTHRVAVDMDGPNANINLGWHRNISGTWITLPQAAGLSAGILVVRANAMASGKSVSYGSPIADNINEFGNEDFTPRIDAFDFATQESNICIDTESASTTISNASKALLNYTIYRLIENQPQAAWTLLSDNVSGLTYTDDVWYTLPNGLYQWAIIANYTTNPSEYRLSNTLNNSTYKVTFSITDDEGTEISDATITFDGNEITGYVVENLFPGDYEWEVSHPEYQTQNGTVKIVDKDETVEVELDVVSIRANTLSDVVLHPNPFTNEIFVRSDVSIKSIQIMNAAGQKVFETNETIKTIETSNLPCGVYFVTIENNKGEKLVHKMVK